MNNIKFPIVTKITLLVVSLVLVTATLVGMTFYYGNQSNLVEKEKEFIQSKNFILANYFKSLLIQNDYALVDLSKNLSSKEVINKYENIIFAKKISKSSFKVQLDDNRYIDIDESLVEKGYFSFVKNSEMRADDFKNYVFIKAKSSGGNLFLTVTDISKIVKYLNSSFNKNQNVYIVNSSGDILFNKDHWKNLSSQIGVSYKISEYINIQDNEVNKILENVRVDEKENNFFVVNKSLSDVYTLVSVNINSVILTARKTRTQTFFVTTALIILSAFLGWVLSRVITRNLNTITNVAQAYARGEKIDSLKIDTNDEIGLLAISFQGMMRQVNERARKLKKVEEETRLAKDDSERASLAKSVLLDDLKKQKEEMMRLTKEKDDLLAIVSHDLKNPLAVVVSSMDILIEENFIKKNINLSRLVKRSKEGANFAINLITDLLDLARLEGGVKLEKNPFSIYELVKTSFRGLELKSEEKNIELKIDSEVDIEVNGDRERVLQVLNNIISNAIKFTPINGKIEVKLSTFETSTDNFEKQLKIEISDNGIGIPEKKLHKIFNKYEQARTKDREIGTGLGLAICKNIVEQHDGNIWVESVEGSGAIFFITLPEVLKVKEIDLVDEIDEIFEDAQKKYALVADDEEIIREALVDILKLHDYQCFEAASGDQALDILKTNKVDLILTDLSMPKNSGVDIVNYMREQNHNVPIVVITANIDVNDQMDLNYSNLHILHKPFEPNDLINLVEVFENQGPVASSVVELTSCQSSEKEVVDKANENVNFLFVDDSEDMHMLITMITKKLDFVNLISAENGKIGLDKFIQVKPDIAFLDINMPEMKGDELIVKIREYEKENSLKETPVFVISANDSPEDIARYKELGFTDSVGKPFKKDQVIELLQDSTKKAA